MSSDAADRVLALIDDACNDWTVSGDAMRSGAPEATAWDGPPLPDPSSWIASAVARVRPHVRPARPRRLSAPLA